MNQDDVFRISVLVLLVGMKIARWPSRRLTGWKASWPGMKKNPGDTILLFGIALVWLAVLIAWLLKSSMISTFDMALPAWLRWVAVAVALAALALLAWADHTLGTNLSITLQIKEGHTLVTTGPYHWVRHPIYAAALLFFIALSVVSANWLFAVCFVGPMALLGVLRIPKEERMLDEAFGESYRQYAERTGRLLPRLGRRPQCPGD